MKVISATILALLAALPAVQAHMKMTVPAPLVDDPDNTAPIVSSQNGAMPKLCRGQLDKWASAPVTKWKAGQPAKFTISGGAAHEGGSCQAAFSEDGGATWKAVKTFYGNCPLKPDGIYDFTVPAEIKAGEAIFAWTWFNKVGNREMYMNCARIYIDGAGGSGLSEYSDMFIANNIKTCEFGPGDADIPLTGAKGETEPAAKPAGLIAVTDTSGCLPAGKNPDPAFKPVPFGAADPPAGGDVQPPAGGDVKPPGGDVKPPAGGDIKPPGGDVLPPAGGDVQPPVEVKPPVDPKPINLTPIVEEVVTPNPGAGGACNERDIGCPTPTTWTLCTHGKPIPMGNVAPGTKCTGNAITKRAAVRFSGAHVARRRVL